MADNLKSALANADNVTQAFGVNVKGQSLALLNTLKEDIGNEAMYELQNAWDDIGADLIRHEFLGTEGHMTGIQKVTLAESCKELIPFLLEECNSWEEIVATLET